MENGQLRIDTTGSVKIISFDNKALFGSQFNKGSNIQIATRIDEWCYQKATNEVRDAANVTFRFCFKLFASCIYIDIIHIEYILTIS